MPDFPLSQCSSLGERRWEDSVGDNKFQASEDQVQHLREYDQIVIVGNYIKWGLCEAEH